MSFFMLGLPLGNAACLLFSGTLAKQLGLAVGVLRGAGARSVVRWVP